MRKKRLAALLVLCLIVCGGCAEQNNISSMPCPEDDNVTEMDYWSCLTLQELYDNSDYVVVGTYQNVAPGAYNMARDLENPELESDEVYMEGLVYRFRVNTVLKGTVEDAVIPVSMCHGMRTEQDGNIMVSRAETFVAPDANTYKILFLVREAVTGHYTPTCIAIQLSAGTARGDWQSATFCVESAVPNLKEDFQLGAVKTLSGAAICSELMVEPGSVVSE